MNKIISFIFLIIFLSLTFNTKFAESGIFNQGLQKKQGSKSDAGAREAETMMGIIKFVLEQYKLDNGIYPTTKQGLLALVKEPAEVPSPKNWRGKYLGRIPLDSWGRPYNYVCPGAYNTSSYDLSSYGTDGVESQDDINNW